MIVADGDHAPSSADDTARHCTSYSVCSVRLEIVCGEVTESTSVHTCRRPAVVFQRMSRLSMVASDVGSVASVTVMLSASAVSVGAAGAAGGQE